MLQRLYRFETSNMTLLWCACVRIRWCSSSSQPLQPAAFWEESPTVFLTQRCSVWVLPRQLPERHRQHLCTYHATEGAGILSWRLRGVGIPISISIPCRAGIRLITCKLTRLPYWVRMCCRIFGFRSRFSRLHVNLPSFQVLYAYDTQLVSGIQLFLRGAGLLHKPCLNAEPTTACEKPSRYQTIMSP